MIEFPCKRSARKLGVSPSPQKSGGVGYHMKKWGNGQMGDHNARWRSADGMGHGMRSLKTMDGRELQSYLRRNGGVK